MPSNRGIFLLLACLACEEQAALDCAKVDLGDPRCLGEVTVDLQGPKPIFGMRGQILPTLMPTLVQISHVDECSEPEGSFSMTPVWRIGGLDDALSSGIVYGEAPPGAEVTVAPVDLIPGDSYHIGLSEELQRGVASENWAAWFQDDPDLFALIGDSFCPPGW